MGKNKAAYLASGGPLDPSLLYAAPVPNRENFWVIPDFNRTNFPSEEEEKPHSIGWDGKDESGDKGDLTWNYKPATKED